MFFPPFLTKKGVVIIFQNLSLSFGLTGPSISEPQPMVKNGIKIELVKEKNHSMREKKRDTNNKKPKRGEEYDAKGTKDIGGRGGGRDCWSWDKKKEAQSGSSGEIQHVKKGEQKWGISRTMRSGDTYSLRRRKVRDYCKNVNLNAHIECEAALFAPYS